VDSCLEWRVTAAAASLSPPAWPPSKPTRCWEYGAAKAAPNSIVRNIAAERGPHNIRANTIAPGIVRTGFSQALWHDGENEGRLSAKIPLGRIAEPDEVVGAAPLFRTPAEAYISGTTLMIDGGRHVI
jgi:dehydrogenase/reductase SDR family protein 4